MNGSRRTTCVADRARRTKRGNSAMAMATWLLAPNRNEGNNN